jgi:hypothetical protein
MDNATIERCNILAVERNTTVSGLVRLLARDAFEALQQKKELSVQYIKKGSRQRSLSTKQVGAKPKHHERTYNLK